MELETHMIIKEVLKSKGSRIETVDPYRKVDEILRVFDKRNISSVVVVSPAGKSLGIVTDRLLIKELARRGSEALKLTAADVMDAPAPTCAPDDTIQDALSIMTERRVRHLLVESVDEAVGLVSIGDLVKFRLRDRELEARVLRELAYAHMSAE
jgi:CBS domain-containing protein